MQDTLQQYVRPRLAIAEGDILIKNTLKVTPETLRKIELVDGSIRTVLLRKRSIIHLVKTLTGDGAGVEHDIARAFSFAIENPDMDDHHLVDQVGAFGRELASKCPVPVHGARAKKGFVRDNTEELTNQLLRYRNELFYGYPVEICRDIHAKVEGRKPSRGEVFGMVVELGLATLNARAVSISIANPHGNADISASIEIRQSAWEALKKEQAASTISGKSGLFEPTLAMLSSNLAVYAFENYTARQLIHEMLTCPIRKLKQKK